MNLRLPAFALLLTTGLAAATCEACGPDVAATAADDCGTVESAAAPTAAPATGTAPSALPAPPYAKALRDQTRQILNGPDFHGESQQRHLVMREWLRRWLAPDPHKKKTEKGEPFNLAALAQVIKVLLIIVLGAGLLWLLWRGWQWLAPMAAKSAPARRAPVQEAQSLLLVDTALPASVSAAASAAWQRGEAVLALSLLYRGAVRGLEEQHRVVLPASATEGECLRLARRSGKAVVSEGFAPIVRAWMALAYARRAPDDFEQLLQVYRRCFENAATGARP